MRRARSVQGAVDISAVSLSGLCMLHCLALPLVLSVLPATMHSLQSEIIHQVLVALAAPLAVSAAWAVRRQKQAGMIISLLSLGVLGLTLGAFVEPLHDFETILTVSGAFFLSVGHILRWSIHRPLQS